MFPVLRNQHAVHKRRAQRQRPTYTASQSVAQRSSEVWSWDITKLLSTRKIVYTHLYVMLDISSTVVVGWLLADRECGRLAQLLIEHCCASHGVTKGSLRTQSHKGLPMISKPVVDLQHRLDLVQTLVVAAHIQQ